MGLRVWIQGVGLRVQGVGFSSAWEREELRKKGLSEENFASVAGVCLCVSAIDQTAQTRLDGRSHDNTPCSWQPPSVHQAPAVPEVSGKRPNSQKCLGFLDPAA